MHAVEVDCRGNGEPVLEHRSLRLLTERNRQTALRRSRLELPAVVCALWGDNRGATSRDMADSIETETGKPMSHADEVVKSMCQSYESAVDANDSVAYFKALDRRCNSDAAGSEPEYGLAQIRLGEQVDYDVAKWEHPIDIGWLRISCTR